MTPEDYARMVAAAHRLDNCMAGVGAAIMTFALLSVALPALAAVLQGVRP